MRLDDYGRRADKLEDVLSQPKPISPEEAAIWRSLPDELIEVVLAIGETVLVGEGKGNRLTQDWPEGVFDDELRPVVGRILADRALLATAYQLVSHLGDGAISAEAFREEILELGG